MPQYFINTDPAPLQPENHPIFVVTGANRGLGYGIVEKLATLIEDGIIYVTSLEESEGKNAVKTLNHSLGNANKCQLRWHKLDVTDSMSCHIFTRFLQKTHGTIDVLINNAGVGFHLDSFKSLEDKIEKGWLSMNVNYFGTKRLTLSLIPLLKPGGRVVNICSQLGKVKKYHPKIARRFGNASTHEEIEELIDEYMNAVKEETCTEKGFHESPYRVSKAAEISLTILHSKIFKENGMKFYAACPGLVNSHMTLFQGGLSIQEGADTPVFLATDSGAPDSALVANRKIVDWF